eukprot:scaffold39249_cov38-Cyclotella_meneghiniana.AAC.1
MGYGAVMLKLSPLMTQKSAVGDQRPLQTRISNLSPVSPFAMLIVRYWRSQAAMIWMDRIAKPKHTVLLFVVFRSS